MGFHHVAIATHDLPATHRFYTEAMGFTLVKVVVAPTGALGGGWAKHVFYDTGGNGMFAVWELHDDTIASDFATGISTGLGLPDWINHIAFDVPDLDALALSTRRWQEFGIDVVELDHEWCTSIYAQDPNDVLVEFCCTTHIFTEAEIAGAHELLDATSPELGAMPSMKIYKALAPEIVR